MSRKFWNWTKEDTDTPELFIEGTIASEESWYEDVVTPKEFKRQLDQHRNKDIIVWINSERWRRIRSKPNLYNAKRA